jgi:hypothetical protein
MFASKVGFMPSVGQIANKTLTAMKHSPSPHIVDHHKFLDSLLWSGEF